MAVCLVRCISRSSWVVGEITTGRCPEIFHPCWCMERNAGNHHIGTVFIYCAIGRIELATSHSGSSRIYRISILSFDTIAETVQGIAELVERCAMEAVIGISDTLECALERDCRHGKGSTLGGRVTLIHILHALGTSFSTTRIQVYFEILMGSNVARTCKSSVLSDVAGVAIESLISSQLFSRAFSIYESPESECKIQSRRQCPIPRCLSESITYIRHKPRKRHRILVAVGNTHISYHHHHTGNTLCRFIPTLIFQWLHRSNGQLQFDGRIHLIRDTNLVVVQLTIFQFKHLSVLCLCRDDEAFRILPWFTLSVVSGFSVISFSNSVCFGQCFFLFIFGICFLPLFDFCVCGGLL